MEKTHIVLSLYFAEYLAHIQSSGKIDPTGSVGLKPIVLSSKKI
ncbi:hypothetical protein VCSRO210_2480 [Vibrio cholerae]|nr:hypothetical protein VCSRO210_2480 [Vibrio cholerae]